MQFSNICISSVQFSHSVVSDSLQPYESQHDRRPCPSPTPRVHSNSHPSSWWCHPAISSSVVSFSSCLFLPLFLPISSSMRVFSNESTLRMRWPKYWSLSCSIIPSKEHPGLISFRMDWLDFLAVQGTHTCILINKFISKGKKEVKGVLTGSWKKASIRQWEQFSNLGLEESVHHCESCSVMSDSLWTHDYKVHWILQSRILEWVAIPFSRGSSQPRDQAQVSHIAVRFFTNWAIREAPCPPLTTLCFPHALRFIVW